MSFSTPTIHELDATTNSLPPRFLIYRLYGDSSISPYPNLGFFPTISSANITASKICAKEFGGDYIVEEVEDEEGGVMYRRLFSNGDEMGVMRWDEAVGIFTGVANVGIVATVYRGERDKGYGREGMEGLREDEGGNNGNTGNDINDSNTIKTSISENLGSSTNQIPPSITNNTIHRHHSNLKQHANFRNDTSLPADEACGNMLAGEVL
ncbi:hypothetical protein BZA77DRAFT_292152 [Pyronema omphalodes]|nr:hypothetical protein BZA77DRAFT_292152 [Pyronema omphalodes]